VPTTDPFFWDGTKMWDVGSLGGTCGIANGLNNQGQVIGISYLAGNIFQHGFRWDKHVGLQGHKSAGKSLRWVEADALCLPFPDQQFDLITAAFGFRNLADYDAGLREMVRLLRPGGECGILDFGEPRGLMGKLYRVYFKHVLPAVGTVVSGVKGPYVYLPASVERFLSPEEMLGRMRRAGFREASWTPYTFGIAGLYRGRK
jgi:ubiquinone/menaquinone biosynthesis methyltransferase